MKLSRSFECAYVELGENRALKKRYGTGLLQVVILGTDGRELGRYAPGGIYEKGDPEALARTMRRALAPREGEMPRSRGGVDRVGSTPPEWEPDAWLQGKPRKLSDLRGKVVLVRFFTNTCPFCAASMPALQKLHRKHADDDLVVIGFYHPKPRGVKRSDESVRTMLKRWKVSFPIAMDTRWRTQQRWWLRTGSRRATSVSFLIDRSGRIRWVHPGPELHPGKEGCNLHPERCNTDYRDLEKAVGILLTEEAPSR